MNNDPCIWCRALEGEHHKRGCPAKRLERIESKLDFILRQNSRKESVPLVPRAYSAMAQAGMDPRSLSTHKVVTGLDDWRKEQIVKPRVTDPVPDKCPACKGTMGFDGDLFVCSSEGCPVQIDQQGNRIDEENGHE